MVYKGNMGILDMRITLCSTHESRIIPPLRYHLTHIKSHIAMFQPSTMDFLRELKAHNTKEWFDENRKRYQAAKDNFLELVTAIIEDMEGYEPDVRGLEPKQTMFRINRDIRFSKNKDPYKTNFGAVFARGGRKSPLAGYYFQLSPENNFAGGGYYMPSSAQLKTLRLYISHNAPTLREILADDEFKDFYGELRGESLKTAPKGFDKDHPDIDLLRMKSFTVMHQFSDEEVLAEDFPQQLVDGFALMQPLVKFINEGLESNKV